MSEKEGMKARIIKRTMDIVARLGIENVTTMLIAKESEITEGAIYKHFNSKVEILENCYMTIVAAVETTLMQTEYSGQDVPTFLNEAWLAYLEYWIENPQCAMFYDRFRHSAYMTDTMRMREAAGNPNFIGYLISNLEIISGHNKYTNGLLGMYLIELTLALVLDCIHKGVAISSEMKGKMFEIILKMIM